MQLFNITIVTDPKSWMLAHIKDNLMPKLLELGHKVDLVFDYADIKPGDIAFLLSCYSVAKPEVLAKNKHNIVVHPSELPKGKGMSPLTWQILEGKNDIPMTLFEAVAKVDAGKVYLRDVIHFNGNELNDEMKKRQGEVTVDMCLEFLRRSPEIWDEGTSQEGESTYYKRRGPKDSELDINKSIAEQFNLFRVVDNESYPAFFNIKGTKYVLKIYAVDD